MTTSYGRIDSTTAEVSPSRRTNPLRSKRRFFRRTRPSPASGAFIFLSVAALMIVFGIGELAWDRASTMSLIITGVVSGLVVTPIAVARAKVKSDAQAIDKRPDSRR